MKPAKTKREAEEQFWKDVKALLTSQFQHKPRIAQKGIDTYQRVVSEHNERGGIREVVYNQGEEQTAEAVNGVIRAELTESVS